MVVSVLWLLLASVASYPEIIVGSAIPDAKLEQLFADSKFEYAIPNRLVNEKIGIPQRTRRQISNEFADSDGLGLANRQIAGGTVVDDDAGWTGKQFGIGNIADDDISWGGRQVLGGIATDDDLGWTGRQIGIDNVAGGDNVWAGPQLTGGNAAENDVGLAGRQIGIGNVADDGTGWIGRQITGGTAAEDDDMMWTARRIAGDNGARKSNVLLGRQIAAGTAEGDDDAWNGRLIGRQLGGANVAGETVDGIRRQISTGNIENDSTAWIPQQFGRTMEYDRKKREIKRKPNVEGRKLKRDIGEYNYGWTGKQFGGNMQNIGGWTDQQFGGDNIEETGIWPGRQIGGANNFDDDGWLGRQVFGGEMEYDRKRRDLKRLVNPVNKNVKRDAAEHEYGWSGKQFGAGNIEDYVDLIGRKLSGRHAGIRFGDNGIRKADQLGRSNLNSGNTFENDNWNGRRFGGGAMENDRKKRDISKDVNERNDIMKRDIGEYDYESNGRQFTSGNLEDDDVWVGRQFGLGYLGNNFEDDGYGTGRQFGAGNAEDDDWTGRQFSAGDWGYDKKKRSIDINENENGWLGGQLTGNNIRGEHGHEFSGRLLNKAIFQGEHGHEFSSDQLRGVNEFSGRFLGGINLPVERSHDLSQKAIETIDKTLTNVVVDAPNNRLDLIRGAQLDLLGQILRIANDAGRGYIQDVTVDAPKGGKINDARIYG